MNAIKMEAKGTNENVEKKERKYINKDWLKNVGKGSNVNNVFFIRMIPCKVVYTLMTVVCYKAIHR